MAAQLDEADRIRSIRGLAERLDLATLVALAINKPSGLRSVQVTLDRLRRLPMTTDREAALAKAEMMIRQMRRTEEKLGHVA